MKKIAILILVVSGFVFGSMRLVSGQQANLESPPITPEFTMSGVTSVIDGIEIPQEVLEYVQLTYDGHAVTKAEKTVREGLDVYRLRVDRDDIQNDYTSFSLIFSRDWKLLGKEKAEVPVPKPQPTPKERQVKPESEEKEKPEYKPPKPEPESENKPEGGQGGGAGTTEEQEATTEPDTTGTTSETSTQADDNT